MGAVGHAVENDGAVGAVNVVGIEWNVVDSEPAGGSVEGISC